jgi:outer membrane protein
MPVLLRAWLGAFLLAAGAQASAPALGLLECYQRAREVAEGPGIAVAEWRAAEARHAQTQAALRPGLGFLLTERLQNERERGGSVEGESNTTDLSQFDARLRAQHTLFSGFRLTRTERAARAEASALGLEAERTLQLLYLDVADAFYELLYRQRDLAALGDLRATLEKSAAELEDRVRLGRSRPAELLNARSDLAEAQVEEETAIGLRDAARALLAFLLDRPAEDLVVHDPSPFPSAPDSAASLAGAGNRLDVQAAQGREEAARLREQAEQAGRRPTLRAQGDVFLVEEPDQEREWSLLLTLEMPLFDAGLTRARVAEGQAQTRISSLQLAALRRRAEHEVRAATIAFLAAAAQRERLREAVAAAEENHRVQEEDYRLGRASQLDALTALAQLHRLRRREAGAELQARASLVRLHVAAGGGAP